MEKTNTTALVPAASVALIQTRQDLIEMARILSATNDPRIVAQTVQKLIFGMDLGIGIAASISQIHLIPTGNGNVSPMIGAGVMASAIKSSGKYDYRVIETDDSPKTVCKLQFMQGETVLGMIEERIEDHKAEAGKGAWAKHPDDMLFARAISKGFRRYCPDIFRSTVYVEGEIPSPEPRNVTPPAPTILASPTDDPDLEGWRDEYEALKASMTADQAKELGRRSRTELKFTPKRLPRTGADFEQLLRLCMDILERGTMIATPPAPHWIATPPAPDWDAAPPAPDAGPDTVPVEAV